MKPVTLYGAPGVGKLTTARALAEQTGFKLFHNHLTFDLVRSLFDFPSAPFGTLAERIRLSAFEAAAHALVCAPALRRRNARATRARP
jgi:SpoVK/Ycf46/Vps4 family AAA+-type ATPase